MSDPRPASRLAPLQRFESQRDIDPDDVLGGHVHFGAYLRHAFDAFQAWYAAMGIARRDDVLGGTVMAHVELDYNGEVFPPGRLVCRLTVQRVGRSSLEHRVEVFEAGTPEVTRASGRAVNVWRAPGGTPAPWPAPLLAKCWAA